jgi:hypothetical protein
LRGRWGRLHAAGDRSDDQSGAQFPSLLIAVAGPQSDEQHNAGAHAEHDADADAHAEADTHTNAQAHADTDTGSEFHAELNTDRQRGIR